MKLLLALVVAFCLVSVTITKPLPEDDQKPAADSTETPKKEEADKPTEAPAASDGATDAGGEKPADKGDDVSKNKEEGAGGDKGDSPKSQDGKGEDKNNPLETYNKVIELLDKTTKTDNVENNFLRAGLSSDLQTYLRNPIVDVIGRVGDFSKVADCFKSIGEDVKKILEEFLKSFKSCKEQKDKDERYCSEDRSSEQGQVSKIASTIAACVRSKKS